MSNFLVLILTLEHFSIIFSTPLPLRMGSERAACWSLAAYQGESITQLLTHCSTRAVRKQEKKQIKM